MLIHEHSERVDATTGQASGAASTVAVQPSAVFFTGTDFCVFGVGCLLLGLIVGWSLSSERTRRARRQRDRFERRWMRASQRFEQAKQVIARMSDEDTEGRRQRSAVA